MTEVIVKRKDAYNVCFPPLEGQGKRFGSDAKGNLFVSPPVSKHWAQSFSRPTDSTGIYNMIKYVGKEKEELEKNTLFNPILGNPLSRIVTVILKYLVKFGLGRENSSWQLVG